MPKKEITITVDAKELQYLEKITSELKLDGVSATIGRMINESGKDWFDKINQEKFIKKIKVIPIEELSDVISAIPFMSRRYRVGFDSEIIEIIVSRLQEWDEAVPELVKTLYRLNNIRIMARDLKVVIEELERTLPGEVGVELRIYDKESVIRLLVSALYKS